jgi:hypothetical protein
MGIVGQSRDFRRGIRLAPHVDMRCQSIDGCHGVVGTPDVAVIGIKFLHIGTHDGLQEFARCHDLFLLKHRLNIAAGQDNASLAAKHRQQHLDAPAAAQTNVEPSEPDERSPHDPHAIADAPLPQESISRAGARPSSAPAHDQRRSNPTAAKRQPRVWRTLVFINDAAVLREHMTEILAARIGALQAR